ncbi:hypothetical protein [Rurimicrobium arvi]
MFPINRLLLRSVIVSVFLLVAGSVYAQPMLPDLTCVTQNGINVITWNCQYDGIKSIAVQRSSDSSVNYTTIGFVKQTQKGVQFYLDGHPIPGNNWYRLKIIFGSDLSWTSNRIKVKIDSSQVKQSAVLPSNDSLQILASKLQVKKVTVDTVNGKVNTKSVITSTVKPKPATQPLIDSSAKASGGVPVMPVKPAAPVISLEIPDIDNVNAYTYIKSQYVFTNPFTGHVSIEIPDAKGGKYSLEFFNSKEEKVIEVPRVEEPVIILDKRNFQKVGVYRFDLYKAKQKVETGYITIY